jgi:hypothetical protein
MMPRLPVDRGSDVAGGARMHRTEAGLMVRPLSRPPDSFETSGVISIANAAFRNS